MNATGLMQHEPCRRAAWLAAVLLVGASLPPRCGAQFTALQPASSPPAATEAAALNAANLEALREENQRALRLAQKIAESEQGESSGNAEKSSKPSVEREVQLRTQLGYVLDQIKNATERQTQLQARSEELAADLAQLRANGPPEERPYTFQLLEQTRDELRAERSRAESLQAVLAAARDARDLAQQEAERKQSARRQAKEAQSTNKSEAAAAALALAVERADLEAKVAIETARLRELEFQLEELQQKLHKQRLTLLAERLAIFEREASFTRDDLQAQKTLIEKQQQDLKQALEWAQRRAADLDQRWAEASRQLEAKTEKDPALAEKVEAHRMGRQIRAQEVTLLSTQLERLARNASAWDRRYEVRHRSATAAELAHWQAETEQYLDQLEREARLQLIRQDELRQDLATLEKKVQANVDAPPAVAEAVEEQRMHLERLMRTYEANAASIAAGRRLHEKLLQEIVGDAEEFDLYAWLARSWAQLVSFWNFELTSVDDRPITVGKIITGIILLVLGVWASRWLSRLFANRLLKRFGLASNAVSAWQSLVFYALVALFTLLALQMVNVPLGVLTFLGGAVAIGVGFGSQNIVNNFISGLILLAERPIRVGDVIQLDTFTGSVERIGARSTRIRTGTNLEIIVPNSTLLQNNVVNWTLGNDRMRSQITLGVAYGSPTRDVSRLLLKAADDHGLILKTPAPQVLFTGFGENALNFELQYWVSMRSLGDRGRVESDIRFMIDSAFREAGISMPFPQRDVHFSATTPLDVRLLTEPGQSA